MTKPGRQVGILLRNRPPLVGALLGGSVFDQLGIQMQGPIGQLLTATVGAVALLWLAKLVDKT